MVNKVGERREAVCCHFLYLPECPAVHFILAHCPKITLQKTVNYNPLELGDVPSPSIGASKDAFQSHIHPLLPGGRRKGNCCFEF